MPNSIFPSQIGFIPSGTNNQKSQLIFGRNITGGWEAVGPGWGGRPDGLEAVSIYLSNGLTSSSPTLPCIITIDTTALETIIAANTNAPKVFSFSLQEAATCETDTNGASTEKRRMFLMSQSYLPSS